MLHDKEITGRIASWDSNGNAVYVGKFNNENFLDRKGRYRNYSTVKTVDRELETLTKDFINGQIDHMGVLKKMDDIRGMLLDIMM